MALKTWNTDLSIHHGQIWIIIVVELINGEKQV